MKLLLRRLHRFSLHIPTLVAHDRGAAIAATLESDQMTTEHEMEDAVTARAQESDVVELGEVSVDTKGCCGLNQFDGSNGYWF